MSGRKSPARPALAIDIVIEAQEWRAAPEAAKTIRRAIAAAAAAVSPGKGELAIVLTDDSAIRALNRQWRGKNEPTNVLSFPAAEPQPGAPVLLGDVVIAYQTAAQEALAEGKPFMHHLAHLTVHGFLHLLGYDHATAKEAATMERLETTVLAALDVPDPYLPRDRKR
jgi:probable rRNA maturation factor